MGGKFIVIDGNSLLFRAYHALPPLATTDGQPTGALLGFTEMLMNLLEKEKPEAAVMVFDAPGPTFRHERYPEYKATRPPTPDDLKRQVDLAHEVARALGLPILEIPGVEADDVIATLARRAAEAGYDVLIVSGDRDLVQVVRPGIRVLATVRGFTDVRLYDEKAAQEEFGVPPELLPELKGLAGDSSDNIPGAPGVGPKTARALLEKFGSIKGIYENIDKVEPPRIRESLKKARDIVELGAELARAVDDIELPLSLEECRWEGFRVDELRRLLSQLEFNKLLPKLPPSEEQDRVKTEVAQSGDQVAEAVKGAEAVAVAGVFDRGRLAGLALAADDWQAVYAHLRGEAEGGLFSSEGAGDAAAEALKVLGGERPAKVGADLKALLKAAKQAGAELGEMEFDVSLADYLIAPHRTDHSLETLAAKYLGWRLAAGDPSNPESAAVAAGQRACAIWQLRPMLEKRLKEIGAEWLYREVEMPLIRVLHEMEEAGIAVDREALEALGTELDQLLEDLAQRIYTLAGCEFNIDSPKQMGEVLFGKLKLPHGRRTKTGYSTSADVLEKLAPDYEIVRLILEYREYAKLRSTYVDGLLRQIGPDGRVHTTFEQMVTATGRLSSRNPNLQNIPIRTEWGRKIRACFVAPGEDWVLISADYSQIELRILAHVSGEERLIEAFKRGEDIHRSTAAIIFDVPPEHVDDNMRRLAKTVNYAVIYGMGAPSLAAQLGMTPREAAKFIEAYFQRLPRVREWIDRTIEQARERLYVETIFGRRRPLPELTSSENRLRSYAQRAATNAPIQGSAADIIKIAMVRLAELLPEKAPKTRMLLQVHDELVFEAPERGHRKVAQLVKEVMEGAAELNVPLVADVKVGRNWRDMEPIL